MSNYFSDSSSYYTSKDQYKELLEGCREVNTQTFAKHLTSVIHHVHDTSVPVNIRLILGEWIFRKVKRFYRPGNPEEVPRLVESLCAATHESSNVILKGLYLHYHHDQALREMASHFFQHRHSEGHFLLQMFNDVVVVQTTPHEKMLSHFLEWLSRVSVYEQKCNLLDVLLRYYKTDPRVAEVEKQMKRGSGETVFDSLYTDQQNAHDENITAEVERVATELVKWYKTDPYPFILTNEESVLEEVKKEFRTVTEIDHLLYRAQIDPTSFSGITIMNVLVALARYSSLSPARELILTRLGEEAREMKGLCSSGYVSRMINVLQGVDEKFSTRLPFREQLNARLTYCLEKAFQNASEEEISGSYQPEYRKEYLSLIKRVVSAELPKIVADYGEKDVSEAFSEVMRRIAGVDWNLREGRIVE
jgi:hypothetical protein